MSTMTDLPNSAKVLGAGYSGDWDDQGGAGSLLFEVAGADRNTFLQVVAGLSQQFTYGSTTVTRLVPLKHPDNYNQYAVAIREFVEGDTVAYPTVNGGIMFEFHRFEVRFATPTFAYDGSEPMITIQRSVSSEMVTRPNTAYNFPSDSLPLRHDVGVPVQIVRYSLTFHRLTTLNNSLYDSLAGKVNSASFRGTDIGKTLYCGCSSSGQMTMGGQASYEATHEFEIRSIPWNQIMRPDGSNGPNGNGFEAPVRLGSSTGYMIDSADLNQLYQ